MLFKKIIALQAQTTSSQNKHRVTFRWYTSFKQHLHKMEAWRLDSITAWATGKWLSSHRAVPETRAPGTSKTPWTGSLCHECPGQGAGRAQYWVSSNNMCLQCKWEGVPQASQCPLSTWAHLWSYAVWGAGEHDTWRPCKEPVDRIPDRWEHGMHVHRMCGKCSVATQSGTGEPEEAMPATTGVMVK